MGSADFLPDERLAVCAFLLLAAPAIGSFLATCISRAARNMPVFGGSRSACPACGRKVSLPALVPILGYLVLRGRCADCGARIDPLYPFMEAATALVFLSTLWAGDWSISPRVMTGLVLGTALTFLAFHDLRTGRLPDTVTWPLIPAGVFASGFSAELSMAESAVGAAVGFGAAWAIAVTYRYFRGRDGLGMGDVKLIAGLGAWLGPAQLPGTILLASSVALAFLLVSGLSKRNISPNARIVFGPFLALSGWIVWLIPA